MGAVDSRGTEEKAGGLPKSTRVIQDQNHMNQGWQEHTTSDTRFGTT